MSSWPPLLLAASSRSTGITVQTILIITAVAAGLVGLLVGVALTEKGRRDRREAIQLDRRLRFRSAVAGSAEARDAVLAEAIDNGPALLDLLSVVASNPSAVADLSALPSYPAFAADMHRAATVRNPVIRGTAIFLLNRFGDPQAVTIASKALSDKDPDVRLIAARSLGFSRTPHAAEALLAALKSGPLPPERVIERLGRPWALSDCLAAITADTDDSEQAATYRAGIARALGLIGSPAAEPILIALLTSDFAEERVNAARALATCGSVRCEAPILRALRDPEPDVRVQAATAIGRLHLYNAIPDLTAAMSDESWWVRSNAATALGRLDEPGMAALQEVSMGSDPYAAQRATEQIVMLGHS